MFHLRLMTDAAIISNRVITPEGIRKAAVLMENGKISALLDELPEVDFPVTDIGNNVLMAGIVDPHVHINEPGRTDWEGFDTATRAAIAGGITSLVEMPLNASPVTTNAAAFAKKLDAARGKLQCNCGFWGGVIPGNEKDIEPLAEMGVLGFKAFLTHSGIDEFPNVTEPDLRKAMPLIAKLGLPLLVHCELSSNAPANLAASRSYADYLASRPRRWENEAIALVIRLSEEFNCPVHIVHLSSSDAIGLVAAAKKKGLRVTAETAPHYLYFCAEDIGEGETVFKCAPPIREKENNEKLWLALKEGIIDFVATDHSPSLPAMKEMESGDFMKAWGGISSLQFTLPVMWTAAKSRGGQLEDMAKWLSEKPAILPGLRRKGRIEPGFDADLVAWDPEGTFVITREMIQHRYPFTPYLNENLSGRVRHTWLNGEKLFEDNGGNGENGAVKFLHLNKGRILYHD